MFKFVLAVLVVALGEACFAQETPQLVLPATRGGRFDELKAPLVNDPISLYRNRRESALRMFQAAYEAAREKDRARAMGLFLIAAGRDPTFGKALFNLGVVCAQDERWQDALDFLHAALSDPQSAKSAASEIERIQAVSRLEASPEGKRERQFEVALFAALLRKNDPVAALDAAQRLIKTDPNRWEPYALGGVLQASLGAYPDSLKMLSTASRLAPSAKKSQLETATEIARRESVFGDLVKNAEDQWEKKEYAAAAKLYADAWENSPGHSDVGMEAATGFLMADQVALATQVLAQLRDRGPADMTPRITGMLQELGAVSPQAKQEAARRVEAGHEAPPQTAADRIQQLVGAVSTPQTELLARAPMALIADDTRVTPIPDPELSRYPLLRSNESAFAWYQLKAQLASPAPGGASALPPAPPLVPDKPVVPSLPSTKPSPLTDPGQAQNGPPVDAATASPVPARTPLPPQPPPLQLPPSETPAHTPRQPSPTVDKLPAVKGTEPLSTHTGQEQMVRMVSAPLGAKVIVDNGNLSCTTPCEVPLSPGRHVLVTDLGGYRQRQKIFEVEKKSRGKELKPVELLLEAKRGKLTITGSNGSPIFVNGNSSGYVTPADIVLNEGDYEISIEVNGKLDKQTVTIKDAGLFKLQF